MALQGYIYRGRKPVHWSPSSRTALAEAELEVNEPSTLPVFFPGNYSSVYDNALVYDKKSECCGKGELVVLQVKAIILFFISSFI